jgi:hypothetical protein
MPEDSKNNISEVQESENTGNTPLTIKSKKKKNIFLRIAKYFFLILIFLIISLLLFTQTSFFKSKIREIALNSINENLSDKDSKLFVGKIEGNLYKEIRFIDVSLRIKEDTLVMLDTVELRYNILGLLSKNIRIYDLIISSPEINLTKVKDRKNELLWNLEYLLQSEKPPDTTKKKFDWDVYVDNLELRNGNVRLVENKGDVMDIKYFPFKKLTKFSTEGFEISKLNIQITASYTEKEKKVDLKRLEFNTNSDFNVKDIKLIATIKDNSYNEIKNFVYVTTRSHCKADIISINNLDITEKIIYKDFSKCEINFDFEADFFDSKDLIFFIPQINFINGDVWLKLKCNGNYGDLNVKECIARTSNSRVDIEGKVKNLNEPDKLYLDVFCRNVDINSSDTKRNLPGIPFPDLTGLGIIRGNLKFKGEPLSFDTEFDLNSSAGDVNGKTYLHLKQNKPQYISEVKFRNVDLEKVTRNNSLKSNLNGMVKANGYGFDYKTLNSSIQFDISSSTFLGQTIQKTAGKTDIDNSKISLDIEYASNTLKTKTSGKVDLSNFNSPVYDLKGTVQNLDISSITKKQEDKSNLNFTYDVKGKNLNPDLLTGDYNFNISPSQYDNYIIPSSPLKVSISNINNQKYLTASSDFIDIQANGNFTYPVLMNVIAANTDKIIRIVQKQILKDTLSSLTVKENSEINKNFGDVNINYKIDIKNILPVNLIIKDSSIILRAKIEGNLKNNANNFSINAIADLKNLKYRDSIIALRNTIIKFDIINNYSPEYADILTGKLDINAKNLKIKNTKIESTDINLDFTNNNNNFRINTVLDSTFGILTKGQLILSKNLSLLTFDSVNIDLSKNILKITEPLQISYLLNDSGKYINFDKFIVSDKERKLELKGFYSIDKNSDLTLKAEKIGLDLFKVIYPANYSESDMIKGTARNFKLNFKGSLENPVLNLETTIDNLAIDTTSLGLLYAIIKYKDNKISPEIALYNTNLKGKLLVNGEIPFQNPITQSGIDTSINLLDRNIYLVLRAENKDLLMPKQIIPIIRDVYCVLNGEIKIDGKMNTPRFTGGLKVSDGRLKVTLNGMNYNFNGDIATDNQKLLLTNSKLYIPTEDNYFITTTGYVDISGFRLSDINFNMTGDVKVFDNSITQNDFGIFGDLYAGSGKPSLTLRGNQDLIVLSGNLLLKKGKIIIPADRQNAYNLYADNFIYKIEFDTASYKTNPDSAFKSIKEALYKKDKRRLDPFELALVKKQSDTIVIPKSSGKFVYDIDVTAQNNIYINVKIDEKTNQEFFGDVKTKLFVDNSENDSLKVRGQVDLGDNAYYKFYKNFKATGFLTFTGDVTNPKLSLTGEYSATTVDPNDTRYTRDVKILLDIKGEARKPELKWKVLVNGGSYGGSDPTDEAISFIVFGKLKDELNASQRNDLFSSLGGNISSSLISSYLSNVIQTYIPFIINTEVNYLQSQNTNITGSADIRFTAELGDATVRFGGQILQDLSNTNVILEYPLNRLLKIKSLSNNLIFQFERIIDPFSQNRNATSTSSRTGALIIYKIKF